MISKTAKTQPPTKKCERFSMIAPLFNAVYVDKLSSAIFFIKIYHGLRKALSVRRPAAIGRSFRNAICRGII
jgi:hypothetical protein